MAAQRLILPEYRPRNFGMATLRAGVQRACRAASRVRSTIRQRREGKRPRRQQRKEISSLVVSLKQKALLAFVVKTPATAAQLLPPIAAAPSDPLPDKRRQRLPKPVELALARCSDPCAGSSSMVHFARGFGGRYYRNKTAACS